MARRLTPQQIEHAELPRAFRGFDSDATRGILSAAASSLGAMTRERDDLQKQVDDLTKAAEGPTDAERLGAVLLTAKRMADNLLAQATEESAALRASAETECETLIARARYQAERIEVEATERLEAARREDVELRRSISAHREEFATFLRSAIAQLEGGESSMPSAVEPTELDGDLLAQLPSE
jgi:cell division septum initiation protein DivIVA